MQQKTRLRASFLLHGERDTIRGMKLIVGNWKMNPESAKEAEKNIQSIKKTAKLFPRAKAVLCVPSLYAYLAKKNGMMFGLQDIFYENNGTFTGMISPGMAHDIGAKYVLLGHSELRSLGETDMNINKKIKAVLKNHMTPILCVGEKERDGKGHYHHIIRDQLHECLKEVPKNWAKEIIIAYEPVWAIGKNALRAAYPEESLEMSIFIKRVLSDLFGRKNAEAIRILYGASVNPKNTEEFLTKGGVDGLLVGRDSLDPKKFGAILTIANRIK